jgi:hypothetical protein
MYSGIPIITQAPVIPFPELEQGHLEKQKIDLGLYLR